MGARFSLRLSTKMGLQTPQTVEVDPTRDDWFRDKRWAGLFQGFRGIAIEFLDRRQKPSPYTEAIAYCLAMRVADGRLSLAIDPTAYWVGVIV
jgi:hypothetical protein